MGIMDSHKKEVVLSCTCPPNRSRIVLPPTWRAPPGVCALHSVDLGNMPLDYGKMARIWAKIVGITMITIFLGGDLITHTLCSS